MDGATLIVPEGRAIEHPPGALAASTAIEMPFSRAPSSFPALNVAPTSAVTSSPSPVASPGQVDAQPKPTFPNPSAVPTQVGPHGIRFDFNSGARVTVPDGAEPSRVRLSDLDTGNVLFETEIKTGHINSSKRYFVRFRVEIWQAGQSVLTHDYDARDAEVLVQFPVGTLGDTIGWMPYAIRFRDKHRCKLTCALAAPLIPLFRDAYPDVTFCAHEEVDVAKFYATYSMGLFFDDNENIFQPCDFRHVGLHRTAGYILGVDPSDLAPDIALEDDSRPIAEPYVCIAVQSTTQSKYWNNPAGWYEVVRFLKDAGYRVVCIDQKPMHGAGLVWTQLPNGAEDQTGDKPLVERARWLRHADFFVGLSSGLSWLAWAAGTPVVMISGFTHPTNEFATPYRVINYHTCNSCWNDPKLRFDHHDFLWCPRHKDTPRQFECTRLITAEQVIATIKTVPAFARQAATAAHLEKRARA